MNKNTLAIGLCAAAFAATLSAQEPVTYPSSSVYLADRTVPNFELSLGLGIMDLDKERTGIDEDGFALSMDFRVNIPSTIVDFEFRCYGGSFSFDDGYVAVDTSALGGKKDTACYLRDQEYSIVGSSFAFLANLNRDGAVNPYIGAGLLIEGWDYTADVFPVVGNRLYPPYESTDDDTGVTFVARAGVDFRLDSCYLRLDASYVGEIYDADDGGQFDLYGDLGFYVARNTRIDIFCDYFTEYKSLVGTVGVTFAF